MQRPYLHSPLQAEAIEQVQAWHTLLDQDVANGDSVWVVVDGALLGAESAQQLESAYGAPTRAFDGTALAAYEELGLLLWPWALLQDRDALTQLRTTLADRPAVSFVRSGSQVQPLSRMLSWLAGASTADHMSLYLRIGDTRVLSGVLPLLHEAQRARLHAIVREWVWPDREGRAQSMVIEAAAPQVEPAPAFVLDGAQYAALLDAAEPDILHAALRSIEHDWHDSRSGAQLHQWLQQVLQRSRALGITRQADQMAFASLALRVPGEFEAAHELGETWLRVRSGTHALADEIEHWTSNQWRAVEIAWNRAQSPEAP